MDAFARRTFLHIREGAALARDTEWSRSAAVQSVPDSTLIPPDGKLFTGNGSFHIRNYGSRIVKIPKSVSPRANGVEVIRWIYS